MELRYSYTSDGYSRPKTLTVNRQSLISIKRDRLKSLSNRAPYIISSPNRKYLPLFPVTSKSKSVVYAVASFIEVLRTNSSRLSLGRYDSGFSTKCELCYRQCNSCIPISVCRGQTRSSYAFSALRYSRFRALGRIYLLGFSIPPSFPSSYSFSPWLSRDKSPEDCSHKPKDSPRKSLYSGEPQDESGPTCPGG